MISQDTAIKTSKLYLIKNKNKFLKNPLISKPKNNKSEIVFIQKWAQTYTKTKPEDLKS